MTATVTFLPSVALARRIAEAREELAEWDDLCAALHDGLVTWEQFEPELTCTDRQQAAYETACQMRDGTKRELAALEAQADGTAPGARETGGTR